MLVGIGALAVPNVGGHLLRSLGMMVPVATGLGIAIWVLGCLLSLSFWIIGIGALVATRAGMPPRLVPMTSGAVPPPLPPAPAPVVPGPTAVEPTSPPPATA